MSELDELLSKQTITEAIYRYCRSMDRIDLAVGYSVWHEDGTADYGPTYRGSGHGFVDWAAEFHRGFEATSHQISNVLIGIAGDVAQSEACFSAWLQKNEPPDRVSQLNVRGRYLDRWSRREGHWRIAHRDCIVDLSTIAYVTVPMPASGSRAGDDPSYALELLEEPRERP